MENIPFEPDQDRLSMHLRNSFQVFLFRKFNVGHDVIRVETEGKIISDYIDNPENKEIRELITQEKFEEASEIIKDLLENGGSLKIAA